MEPLSCAAQVLLSCNILGNPIGVFTSLGTGVRDFFKHPAEGAVVSPADFALGVGEWRSPFVVPVLCPCCAPAVTLLRRVPLTLLYHYLRASQRHLC
jgi:hypothetical protein